MKEAGQIKSALHSLFWAIDYRIEKIEDVLGDLQETSLDCGIYEDQLLGVISDLATLRDVFRPFK